jgi:hypothetical protein
LRCRREEAFVDGTTAPGASKEQKDGHLVLKDCWQNMKEDKRSGLEVHSVLGYWHQLPFVLEFACAILKTAVS